MGNDAICFTRKNCFFVTCYYQIISHIFKHIYAFISLTTHICILSYTVMYTHTHTYLSTHDTYRYINYTVTHLHIHTHAYEFTYFTYGLMQRGVRYKASFMKVTEGQRGRLCLSFLQTVCLRRRKAVLSRTKSRPEAYTPALLVAYVVCGAESYVNPELQN